MPVQQSALEALAEQLGEVAGSIERDARLRIDAAIADLRRIDAERELRLVNLERAVADRLAAVRDGERGPAGPQGERGEKGDRGEAGPPGERGADGLNGADGPAGPQGERGEKGDRGEAGPQGERGADGLNGADGPAGPQGERGEKGERGEAGPQGRLAAARDWTDSVHYEGSIVTHLGATWQATRDTGREPPHEDWLCLASAGRDGADGTSFAIEGTFDALRADYRRLSVVALNGGSFVARRDNPGPCPGDGWQLLASVGKTGRPGERGGIGARGPAGPAVVALHVSDQGLMTLTNADGSIAELDLYPLLSKLQD